MILKNIFYATVVLYNKCISDSLSCNNLEKIKGHHINIIIVDNSTIDMGNKSISDSKGWTYISMQGNKGLSAAYNKVLDSLEGQKGFVIWFDDDTSITQSYFDLLDRKITEQPKVDIFAPVIVGQDGKIYSPNEARFFKNKQLKQPSDQVRRKRFNAINSCTAIRLSIFNDYRYDERLFLDQVDHNFFEDQRELNRNFEKLNVVIHHNFSLKNKETTPEQCWERYKIMIPDYLLFCSKKNYRIFLGMVKVFGWGIREAIKHKYPLFVFWCCKYGLKKMLEIKKVIKR